MKQKSIIARIPGVITDLVLYVSETRKWSIATALTEIGKTSPFYLEYLAHKENRVS